jgi:hypothetical protein
MPAPNVSLTFSAGVAALERIEEARKAREERMRNALEILSDPWPSGGPTEIAYRRFVRATARGGLGDED